MNVRASASTIRHPYNPATVNEQMQQPNAAIYGGQGMGQPRMAGMALGMGPADMGLAVSNPAEITKRVRYSESFPQS